MKGALVPDIAIFAQNWLKIAKREKKLFLDQSHNQHQYPTVHTGGVSLGRVRGCGCCR